MVTIMKIFQLNVRLAEGGAAGVALDLHRRALKHGVPSFFVYGYGKSGLKSKSHESVPNVIKNTSIFKSYLNLLCFPFINYDLFGNINKLRKEIEQSDPKEKIIVHLHVLHSYWLNYHILTDIFSQISSRYNISYVWTLHDHWAITGRCAFLNNCQNWKNNCYECPQKNNYPPVRIDNARNELSNKIDFVKKMSLLGCKFISPSLHVAKSFNMQYSHIGISECRVINNGFDIDSENFISTLSLEKSDNYKRKEINDDKKRKFAVVAHDLAYDGKTDANLINSVPMHDIEIHTFGKNSPFNNDVFVNHGYISNKDDLLVHLRHMDALIFTSKVDNYPLILCECLSLGIPVVATRSEASIEVLSKVNGRVISEDELSKCLSMDKIQLCQYLYNQTLSELKARASDVFSGNMMLKEYMKIYETI